MQTEPHGDKPPPDGQAPTGQSADSKRSFFGHALRWLGHSLTGTVAAVLLIVPLSLALLVLRLLAGPVSLGPLKDDLLAAFDQSLVGYTVQVQDALLVWGGWQDPLQLQLRGVVARPEGPDGIVGTAEIRLPDGTLRFDLVAAMQGVVAPTRMGFLGPQLALTIAEDGSIDIGLLGGTSEAAPAAGSDSGGDLIGGLLAALLGGTGSLIRGDKLTEISILNGTLYVDDRRDRAQWSARNLSLSLRRAAAGVQAVARFTVPMGRAPVLVTARASYHAGDGVLDSMMDVTGLNPAALAELSPRFAALAPFDMSMNGAVQVRFANGLRLQQGSLTFRGRDGLLTQPDQFPQPVPVNALTFSALGNFGDPKQQHIDLDVLAIDLGGPTAVIRGEAYGDEYGGWQVNLVADAREVPVSDLKHYWPLQLAEPARAWIVKNLEDGIVPYAEMQADLLLLPDWSISLNDLAGHIDFEGVTTHYLRPLPPGQGLTGRADFGPSTFNIVVTAGRDRGLVLGETQIDITEVDTPIPNMTVDLVVQGPLREALDLMDRRPLELLDSLGLEPDQASGQAAARLRLAFPLLKDLRFNDISVGAAANLRDVALVGMVPKLDLVEGDFVLSLDGSGMAVDGVARLAGQSADLSWREAFNRNSNPQRQLTVATSLTPDLQQHLLGTDVSAWLQGTVPVTAHYARMANGASYADITADLTSTHLLLPQWQWQKPPGIGGMATARLELGDQGIDRVGNISVLAG